MRFKSKTRRRRARAGNKLLGGNRASFRKRRKQGFHRSKSKLYR